jgi:hypothetical protein
LKALLNHKEFTVLTVSEAVNHLIDESKEFYEEPSLDELSDIAFAINRLAGAIVRIKYLPVILFLDIPHIIKKLKRIKEYGHFRSRRVLQLGPTERWS